MRSRNRGGVREVKERGGAKKVKGMGGIWASRKGGEG